ncbi:MAG: hypothetical protein U1U88_002065 [Lawsonella clevelandensis]
MKLEVLSRKSMRWVAAVGRYREVCERLLVAEVRVVFDADGDDGVGAVTGGAEGRIWVGVRPGVVVISSSMWIV